MQILARGLLQKIRVINTNDELGWMTFDLPPHASNTDEFVQPSSDLLGPRASRPQRAVGAQVFGSSSRICSRFALIASGTPAVPANHLTGSIPTCRADRSPR